MSKKILAALLALAMCASLLCAGVLADGETAEGEGVNEARVGEKEYETLQEAVDAVESGAATGDIVVLKNLEDAAVQIDSSVTIDLNNHLISSLPHATSGEEPDGEIHRPDDSVPAAITIGSSTAEYNPEIEVTIKNGSIVDGAGIRAYSQTKSLKVENVTFSNNCAGSGSQDTAGSAINFLTRAEDLSSVTITDCEFLNNYTVDSGTSNEGGAVRLTAGGTDSSIASVKIERSDFTGNYTGTGAGGALHISGASSVYISGCSFSSNTADSSVGGAINVQASDYVIISSTTFTGNSAASGGAITIANCGTEKNPAVIAETVEFNNNKASSGGAIYISGDAFATINCDIQGHSAASGGAIVINNGFGLTLADITEPTVTINGNLNNNTATSSGGALYIRAGNITINGDISSNNGGSWGGGIFATFAQSSQSPTYAKVTVNGSITENSATYGGGVYSNYASVTVNGVVSGNTAKKSGGGLYNNSMTGYGSIVLPADGKVYDNTAVEDSDDICNNTGAITISAVPSGLTLSECGHAITGWYLDGADARWDGHTNEDNAVEYNLEEGTVTISEQLSLKAAHEFIPSGTVTITPADITIYMGGDDGYEGVVGGTQMGSDSLPPPLFYVQLPEGLEDVDVAADMKMYGDEGREWKFIHVGEDEDSVPLYYIESTGYDTQDPVRVTYTDTDGGDPIISDAFDPVTVGEVFNDYTIAVYRGNSGEVSVDIGGVRYAVETGTGTLRVRAVEDTEGGENPVVGVTAEVSEPVGAGKAAITAPEDTEYTLNNTTVKVEAAGVGLLFDGIIDTDVNRTNALVERAEDALGGSFGNRYQAQYLDLVDAENGNAWVKADNKVTVYWGYPEGTGRYTDFTLLHFEDLHRDGALSGFDVADVDDCTVTEVEIRRTANGIAFDIESGGFSPFLLVWNVKTDPGPGPGPGPDTEPDEPGWPVVRPDEPEGLNTEDHVAYIIGYPDGGVHPTGDITRAEVATIFFRLLTDEARDEYWSSESGFTDVESGDWFNNAVSTLAKMGILGGYEDGSFRPNAPITRAEFTKIAVSFFEKASEVAYDGRFTDIAGSEWYADAVAGAAYYGLIDGYGDGTFRPGANITRAEACTIVNRVLGRAPHEDHLLPAGEMLTWPDNKPGAWYYADMQEATNSHDYEWAGEIENWLEKLPERDWDALEREWSDAHSAPGGEVMG